MKPSAETASRNRRSNWDAVSQSAPRGKAHPTPSSNSGTQFPDGGHLGKRIPLWSLIPGRSFPKRTQRESASRFEAQKWDALSARSLNGSASHFETRFRVPSFPNRLNGKVCPTLESNSGTRFPKRAQRETVSHSERQFWDAVSASSKRPRLAMEPGPKAQRMRLRLSRELVRALPYPRLRTRLYGVSTMGRSGRSLPSKAR